MAGFDTGCLYSTVKNTSNEPLTFSFLPPHGRSLASGGEFSFIGHPVERMRNGGRNESMAHVNAFESALKTGRMTIKKTPLPVFYDTGTGATKVVSLHLGVLVAHNPCWVESVFSA